MCRTFKSPNNFFGILNSQEGPESVLNYQAGATVKATIVSFGDETAVFIQDLQETETRGYNVMGELTSIHWDTPYVPYPSHFDTSAQVTYNYAATANNGQITSMSDTRSGETVTYQYDQLKKLITASSKGGTNWTQAYTFDGFGNLTAKTTNGAVTNYPVDPVTNRISNGNVGSASLYDNNGNMTGAPGARLSYDGMNRVVQANVNTAVEHYPYGSGNRRIITMHSNGTVDYTLYGVKGEKLGVYRMGTDQPGQKAQFTVQKIYIWFGGRMLTNAQNPEGGVMQSDRLGTTGSGFYPFGEAKPIGGGGLFATYEADGFTGLNDAVNRWHLPGMGRFGSADPYQASAGTGDPGSWNRYTYVSGNPINHTDRRGLADDDNCEWDSRSSTLSCPAGDDPPAGGGGGGGGDGGGGDGGGGGGGDQIATFGTTSTPIWVPDYSKSGTKQSTIAGVFSELVAAISSDTDCSGWLRGADISGTDFIAALLDNNSFGYGSFKVNTVAAFAGSKNTDGSPSGVPVTSAITVNANGAFFNSGFVVGARAYKGGTLMAQAAILIHEVAHVVGAQGFKSDFGDAAAGKSNDALVDNNCSRVIKGLQ